MTVDQTSRITRRACAGALTLLAGMACSGAQEPGLEREPDPSGSVALAALIVSNPAGSAAHAAFTGSGGSAVGGFVYASLPPGSIPNGTNVVIATRRTGVRVTAEMVEGGFDPVLVAADAGDTLDVRVALAGDLGALAFVAVVPLSSPPVVVRTVPPPKKRDVPLNAVLLVVFSEPIDPATLTASSMRLTLGGVPVAGTLAFGDATHLTATFTPAPSLVAAGAYTLTVAGTIADLDGDVLGTPVMVEFVTELPSSTDLTSLVVSNPSNGSAWVSLPPGTLTDGATIVIRTRRTGVEVTALPFAGGLDPIPVPAVAGDTLDLRIETVADGGGRALLAVVPARRAPVVVRTDPPSAGQDVPRDASFVLVLSEPIDAATVTASAAQVFAGGTAVAGTLAFADAAHVAVRFAPATPLAAGTAHTLLVTQALADRDGEALAEPVSVSFVTRNEPQLVAAAYARITPWTFEANAPRYVLRENGTFAIELTDVAGWTSFGEFRGTYTVSGDTFTFYFADDGVEQRWRAAGVRHGDSLTVEYNAAMRLARPGLGYVRFDDGVYLRSGSPVPPLPALTGRIAFAGDLAGSAVPHIYVAHGDGSGITRLTSGRSPAWSPDGRRIAFARWSDDASGPSGIYVMDADGSNATWLVAGSHPAWSPDGARIVFSGTEGIQVVNADGSGAVTLLDFEATWGFDPDGMGGVDDPAWSPDGQYITFTRLGGEYVLRTDQVYVMRADGSQVRPLIGESGCGRRTAAWAPDGTEVALMACGHVALASGDGSAYRWLIPGAYPTWSPDGRWLAFAANGDVYVIDRNGGMPRLLIASVYGGGSGGFAWTSQE